MFIITVALHPFLGRIVLLMSSPRCGSSMLAQMLQSTDECIVYSELDALSMIACFLDETRWSLRRIRALLSITIRLLITTDNPIHTTIVLRCRANTIRLVPHIRRVQPSVRLLFMHRRQLDAQLLSMMQFSEQQCDNAFNRVRINHLNTKIEMYDIAAAHDPIDSSYARRLFHHVASIRNANVSSNRAKKSTRNSHRTCDASLD